MFEIIDFVEDDIRHDFALPELRHLASELANEFGFADGDELKHILNEAFDLCTVMNIPIDIHFRQVYLYRENELITDWLVSDLGCYLLLINGNNRNLNVARAKMYIFLH